MQFTYLLSAVAAVVAAAALPTRISGLAIRRHVEEAPIGLWRRTEQTITVKGILYKLEEQPTLHPGVYRVESPSETPLVAIKYDDRWSLNVEVYKDLKSHVVRNGAVWAIRDGPSRDFAHFTDTPEYLATVQKFTDTCERLNEDAKKLIWQAVQLVTSQFETLDYWRYSQGLHLNDFMFNFKKQEVYVLWITAMRRKGQIPEMHRLLERFVSDWHKERRDAEGRGNSQGGVETVDLQKGRRQSGRVGPHGAVEKVDLQEGRRQRGKVNEQGGVREVNPKEKSNHMALGFICE